MSVMEGEGHESSGRWRLIALTGLLLIGISNVNHNFQPN